MKSSLAIRIDDMTIQYDAEKKRATHVETGVAVEFSHDGPYAQERNKFLNLIFKGQTVSFECSYNFGGQKIDREFPNLSTMEQAAKRDALKEMNYRPMLPRNIFESFQSTNSDFPQVFVELLQKVLAERYPTWRVSVYYSPYTFKTQGEWSVEG